MALESPKVLVTGVTGQVGSALVTAPGAFGSVLQVSRANANLASPGQIGALIRKERPEIVVNAAAYTQVDKAESDADLCRRVNSGAVQELAEASCDVGALVVHYSTDYVFDGTKRSPYVEDDEPCPLSVYGASKLAGERAIEAAGGPSIILRTSWVYGPTGRNFVRTILSLGATRDEIRVVDDQIGAPTASGAIADATWAILHRAWHAPAAEQLGRYNLTAGGATTWCQFARTILETSQNGAGRSTRVVAITTEEFAAAAPRPRYSILDTAKVQRVFGVVMRQWNDELPGVLSALVR